MTTAPLVFASLRLPITVRRREGALELVPSVGGLATGLAPVHARGDALWVGWTGLDTEPDAATDAELRAALAERRLRAIPLHGEEGAAFHRGYANRVLWPVLHGQLGRMPLVVEGFESYARINERIADACADAAAPGATVWVHDYQLMLVPALLRRRRPDLRIGFFLHVPFAGADAIAVLPQRERLLEGLLGADLIGVHTHRDLRHLLDAARRLLDLPQEGESVHVGSRRVRLGVFPMGIDAARFRDAAAPPAATAHAGAALLLGIDRLDYTKGLPRRLLAFERLLAQAPELHGRVHLLQVAVPSRSEVQAYRRIREEVEAIAGRVNGRFGTPEWTPISYVHRALPFESLVGLYRAADVMLVTPLRDGLNLVAKEYVAARQDDDGVLVLSEFAGAADELTGALRVNPYDVDGVAATLRFALGMPLAERRRRMQQLRAHIAAHDGNAWATRFLDALAAAAPAPLPRVRTAVPGPSVGAAAERLRRAHALRLLLDYDGTLVPIRRRPEDAVPDEELLHLLRRLAGRPRTEVHIVSGRPREVLDEWLGGLPIGLHAEHGLWSRRAPDGRWRARGPVPPPWLAEAETIVRRFTERTPGSRLERKSAGLAWHFREVVPDESGFQAMELHQHLDRAFVGRGVQVLRGDMVVEVRPAGVHKGLAAVAIASAAPPDTLLVACGDDRTDADLFAAVEPEGGLTVAVGDRLTHGTLALPDSSALRHFLASLLETDS